MENEQIKVELIKTLLDNPSYAGYDIEQQVGVSRNTVARLRRGESKVENITLTTALALQEYAMKNLK